MLMLAAVLFIVVLREYIGFVALKHRAVIVKGCVIWVYARIFQTCPFITAVDELML
jgi:hypothetical protein